MARRVLNRRELRAASDAAERREEDEEEKEKEEEEEDDDEDDDEAEGDAEAEPDAEAEADDDEGDEGDEDEPRPKKKKKKVVVKPKAKPKAKTTRTRTPKKAARMKVVWGVFNNSNARVAVYDYPRRADADAHALKLTTDKKSTHFVQPVKEPMEEKKEE